MRWLLLAFAVLAAAGSLLTPLFEVPDEHEHLKVAYHWAREGSMPDLSGPLRYEMDEGVQPPLAYWIFAAGIHLLDLDGVEVLPRWREFGSATPQSPGRFQHGADEVWPFDSPVLRLHLLRLISVLCGLLVVLATMLLARQLLPQSALLAGALVAANPQFAFQCGGISNDALAIALSTMALVLLIRGVTGTGFDTRHALTVGALIGAAHLAKLSATFLIPTAAVALLLAPGRKIRPALLIAASFLLVAGGYFAWNLIHYGDPFAWSVGLEKFPVDPGQVAPWKAVIKRYLPRALEGYAGRFGAEVHAGVPLTRSFALAFGIGALLLPVALFKVSSAARRGVLLLLVAVAANLAAAITYYLDFNQSQGRYLFPSIGAAAALVALGWSVLLPRFFRVLGVVVLLLVSAHAHWTQLRPAYADVLRADDSFLMSTNPFPEDAPQAQRVTTLGISGEPPELSWVPQSESARYSVHLSSPGLEARTRTFEDWGELSFDRWTIPQALWDRIPSGMSVELTVVRMPTRQETLAGPLTQEVSAPVAIIRP